jgi:hypothetical protein
MSAPAAYATELTTTPTTLYSRAADGAEARDDGRNGCTICVANREDDGGANVLVRVRKLHGVASTAWARLKPGEKEYFRVGDNDLDIVEARTESGSTSNGVDHYLCAVER